MIRLRINSIVVSGADLLPGEQAHLRSSIQRELSQRLSGEPLQNLNSTSVGDRVSRIVAESFRHNARILMPSGDVSVAAPVLSGGAD